MNRKSLESIMPSADWAIVRCDLFYRQLGNLVDRMTADRHRELRFSQRTRITAAAWEALMAAIKEEGQA